jgi:hypothetical protein
VTDTLCESLQLQVVGELVSKHGIDPSLFQDWALHVGPCNEFKCGLEAWAEGQNSLTTHGQIAARSGVWSSVRMRLKTAEGGWSLFSVAVTSKGYAGPGKAFIGHRNHPSVRSSEKVIKFDTTGWHEINKGIFLPPLSFSAAIDLLGPRGFEAKQENYEPWHAWHFIVRTPSVSLHIEESALKAMAACSIGQLAVGLNGINSWGQKGRPDRLRPFLNRVAKGHRKIVVRFDCPEKTTSQSEQEARKLAHRLSKEGAEASWWCWLPLMPAKTDDVVAALITGKLEPDQNRWIDYYVSGKEDRDIYCRLRREWPGKNVNWEFSEADVVIAAKSNRVIALKGATGTSKSKALLGGLECLEHEYRTKFVVLGCYHRRSLVHKGAAEFGVVDLSSAKGSAERCGLYEDQTMRNGLFCCGESAYKESNEMSLWHWFWSLTEHPRPTVLILDEISQVLSYWVMDGTEAMRQVRAKALVALEGLIQLPCVHVWAADALLGDIELEWLQGLSGEAPFLIRSTFTRKRDLYLGINNHQNKRALLMKLQQVVSSNGRFWLGCGTVSGLNSLMDSLKKPEDGTELRVTGEEKCRKDPRVAKLMADTEREGPNYQRVGFSPAISCGISMATTPVDLTAVVQEHRWQAEDVLQALNRARNSKVRILIAPKVAPDAAGITKETSAKRAAEAFEQKMRAGVLSDYAALLEQRHPATRRAVAQLDARRNFEAFNNDWCLQGLLAAEGYQIRDISEIICWGSPDSGIFKIQDQVRVLPIQDIESYKLAALQRLIAGSSTIQSEQLLAKRYADGGIFLDLAEVDVSETWAVVQELGLDVLVNAGTVHAGSAEILRAWAALGALDRVGAKHAARVLGTRADRIPGPQDALDVRRIWPLLKVLGFVAVKDGKSRAMGNRWRFKAIEVVRDQ